MLVIDGSFGEGGGQVLRTSLSLSCILGIPFRIVHIRSRRKTPGLAPQHLMAVRAAAEISGAAVTGAELRSTELTFTPGPVAGGSYRFDIGTAGALSLVLQTVLPALACAPRPSAVTVTGGSHVPMSPPVTYIEKVFLPFLHRIGVPCSLRVDRFGFYPKGGGSAVAKLPGRARLLPLQAEERGGPVCLSGVSAVARLPLSIAERQRDAARRLLEEAGYTAAVAVASVPSVGPGTFLFIEAQYPGGTAGLSALGERGKRAETVGEEAAREMLAFLATGAALDRHLADQALLYCALAEGESRYTCERVTDHLLTNAEVVRRFTGARIVIQGKEGLPGRVVVKEKGIVRNRAPESSF